MRQQSLSFTVFTRDFLQLDPRLSRRVWGALCQSRWSSARELRQMFQLHDGLASALDFTGLTDHAASPTRLVAVLEDLVRQRLLSRQEVNQVTERVLRLSTKNGTWPARVPA